METRSSKLIISKAGGTASDGSKTYKVSLPSVWINVLEINEENRDLELSFDGERITILPELTIDKFIANAKKKGNRLLKLDFYHHDDICTTIIADHTDEKVKIKNHTSNVIYRAFGINENPTWEDYNDFLEERCVPRTRERVRVVLDTLGIDEYNPLEIIKKTKGIMAEDDQWLDAEEL